MNDAKGYKAHPRDPPATRVYGDPQQPAHDPINSPHTIPPTARHDPLIDILHDPTSGPHPEIDECSRLWPESTHALAGVSAVVILGEATGWGRGGDRWGIVEGCGGNPVEFNGGSFWDPPGVPPWEPQRILRGMP